MCAMNRANFENAILSLPDISANFEAAAIPPTPYELELELYLDNLVIAETFSGETTIDEYCYAYKPLLTRQLLRHYVLTRGKNDSINLERRLLEIVKSDSGFIPLL